MRSKLRQDTPMDVYPVRLTAAHALLARKFGEGNLSDGVRLAIESLKDKQGALPTKPPDLSEVP